MAIQHEIRAIIDQLDNSNKLTRYLTKIATEVINGGSTNGRLCKWLKKSFPSAKIPRGPCLRGQVLTGSRICQRRQEYAILQKLYEKDRGTAARLILNEPENNTMPSREDMNEFWSQVFGNERAFVTASPDAEQEKDGLRGLWAPIKVECR